MKEVILFFKSNLNIVVWIFFFIPIIWSFSIWKSLKKAMKVFSIYLLFINICTLINLLFNYFIYEASFYYFVEPFLLKYQITDSSFLQIMYFLNNTLFVGLFYSLVLNKYLKKKKILLFTAILIVIEIFNYLYVDGVNKLGIFNPVLDTIICFSFPSIYFYFLFKDEKYIPIKPFKNPYFLLSLGLFFPNIIAFFFFGIQEKIFSTDPDLYNLLTFIKYFFQITAILLYTLAFKNHKMIRFMN